MKHYGWTEEEKAILLSKGPEEAAKELTRSLCGCQTKYYVMTGTTLFGRPDGRMKKKKKIVFFKNPELVKAQEERLESLNELPTELVTIPYPQLPPVQVPVQVVTVNAEEAVPFSFWKSFGNMLGIEFGKKKELV
jgi:hypothetical protein